MVIAEEHVRTVRDQTDLDVVDEQERIAMADEVLDRGSPVRDLARCRPERPQRLLARRANDRFVLRLHGATSRRDRRTRRRCCPDDRSSRA